MNIKRNIAGPLIRATGLHKYFGYTPAGVYEAEDVFLVGYPKSGNSWMQHMLTGIVYDATMKEISNRLVRELTPDVHLYPFYRRYRSGMCFKSHHLPMREYRKVIYIVRDGRDAVTSYHHMLLGQGRDVAMADLVIGGKHIFPSKWHEHTRQWIANPFGAQMHFVRYEDLKTDALGELKKICVFLELDRTEEQLRSIIGNCSFEAMRLKETSVLWDKNENWKEGKFFVRKGAVGDFRSEMPQELIDHFNREAAGELMHFQYKVN